MNTIVLLMMFFLSPDGFGMEQSLPMTLEECVKTSAVIWTDYAENPDNKDRVLVATICKLEEE